MTIRLTARGVLNIVFRHQWRFVGALFLVLGVAVAYCVVAKPYYKSEALLLVKFNSPRSASEPLASAAIQAQASERKEVMNSQGRILRSRDIMVELVGRIGVERLYPDLVSKPPSVGSVEDNAVISLDKDLEVEATRDANVLQVSLLNHDPVVAAEALKVLIARFRARQSEIFQNPQSNFLQEQLEQARQQLGASQAAVEQFKAESGISSLDEERTLQLRVRAEARNNLAQQSARLREAESRFAALTQALRTLPQSIQLSDENDRFRAVDDARARLSELRARETEMSTNYRDESVAVRTLRAQIQFAEQELAQRSRDSLARVRTGPNPVFQQIQTDLFRAQAEAGAAGAAMLPIEDQLAEIERRIADLDSKQGRLQDLMLQMQVDEENFRSIMQRNEEARVSADLQRQNITSIAVIQEPTVPIEKAKPRVLLILVLGGLAGIAAACAACYVSDMVDESFSQPEQLGGQLKLPVLATFNVVGQPAGVGRTGA